MADYSPSDDVLEVITRPTASRRELKESLMRRAWDGKSKHTPAQMILLIQWRLSANNITNQDRAILNDINSFKLTEPPRSILMLDAHAREAEKTQIAEHGEVVKRVRYEYNPSTIAPPPLLQ